MDTACNVESLNKLLFNTCLFLSFMFTWVDWVQIKMAKIWKNVYICVNKLINFCGGFHERKMYTQSYCPHLGFNLIYSNRLKQKNILEMQRQLGTFSTLLNNKTSVIEQE